MAGTVVEVSSKAELQALCGSHTGLSSVLLWAPWHPPSMHLTKVLDALAAEHKAVRFAKCNTDVCADLASSLGADQVPFVAFLDPRGKKIDALAGANPPKLLEKVKALSSRPFDKGSDEKAGEAEEDLNSRLKSLITFSPVMLFMKGSKVEPQCGFSRKAVEILDRRQIEYSTFDILKDEDVRQGLKEYSNWKTYPQLYIDGELIGGIDILKEMDEDGTLVEAVGSSLAAKDEKPLEERLHELINKGPVTLFMKGNPEAPRCGFSRKTVELLSEHGIKFEHFDILEDEEVRQGLKSYSNWPTYPQVYANGKLVGGLDILKEMAEEGSLVEELKSN